MIKLIALLKEIEAEQAAIAKLTPEEKEQYNQALALLQDDTLDEGLKDSLKKLGLSAAVILALAATPLKGTAQKAAVDDLKAQITSTTSNISVSISAQEKKSWNEFHKWLESKGYAGDSSMNSNKFRQKVLNQYKKETGVDAPDTNFVKKLQQYQIDSRNDIIKSVEAGKASVDYDYKKRGWDGFQPEVLSMEKHGGPDGKIGEETSKYYFRVWKDTKGNLTNTYTIPGEIKNKTK